MNDFIPSDLMRRLKMTGSGLVLSEGSSLRRLHASHSALETWVYKAGGLPFRPLLGCTSETRHLTVVCVNGHFLVLVCFFGLSLNMARMAWQKLGGFSPFKVRKCSFMK